MSSSDNDPTTAHEAVVGRAVVTYAVLAGADELAGPDAAFRDQLGQALTSYADNPDQLGVAETVARKVREAAGARLGALDTTHPSAPPRRAEPDAYRAQRFVDETSGIVDPSLL